MVKIVNGDIELIYEWGLPFGPMPRMVIGAVGVILIASATLLFLIEYLKTGATALPASERLAACALLLLIGGGLTLRSVLSKSSRLGSVSIGDAGMTFRWKSAGAADPTGRAPITFVEWRNMEKIEWTEEGLEHEFKQYLSIILRTPIANNTKRYKFLICDTRSHRECQALHAKIPPQATRPASVLAVLQHG